MLYGSIRRRQGVPGLRIDPAGIALAAIQELHKQNQELQQANEELRRRVKRLEEQ